MVDSDFHLISTEGLASTWGFYLELVLKVHHLYIVMAQEILEVAGNIMHHEPSEKEVGDSSRRYP